MLPVRNYRSEGRNCGGPVPITVSSKSVDLQFDGRSTSSEGTVDRDSPLPPRRAARCFAEHRQQILLCKDIHSSLQRKEGLNGDRMKGQTSDRGRSRQTEGAGDRDNREQHHNCFLEDERRKNFVPG